MQLSRTFLLNFEKVQNKYHSSPATNSKVIVHSVRIPSTPGRAHWPGIKSGFFQNKNQIKTGGAVALRPKECRYDVRNPIMLERKLISGAVEIEPLDPVLLYLLPAVFLSSARSRACLSSRLSRASQYDWHGRYLR